MRPISFPLTFSTLKRSNTYRDNCFPAAPPWKKETTVPSISVAIKRPPFFFLPPSSSSPGQAAVTAALLWGSSPEPRAEGQRGRRQNATEGTQHHHLPPHRPTRECRTPASSPPSQTFAANGIIYSLSLHRGKKDDARKGMKDTS